ncbi:hypothetical protein HUT19_41385 (plasmid) [Streptomyces sp. NA02950]|uniref:hypothetical protein n=1 Tax=Streptomyces sp. NA02950 TaxID=2742137 RepID=UPI001591C8F1|nr:hypothetical protein [Streptomyces sp. NA02950]QKV98177.1 hypothetical protein HUT19_41385 [Streptomyces sp. NA02950]
MTENSRTYPARHAAYLTEVDARQAAATDGDWGVYDQGTMVEVVAGLQETDTGYRCRRQIARLDEEPIDNIDDHDDWTEEQDYAQLLSDGTFMAHSRTDVPRLLDIVAEQHQRAETAEQTLDAVGEVIAPAGQPRRVPTDPDAPLAESIAWLADRAEELDARLQLVREFRIPVKNRLGGYAEVTVERGPGPYDDRWAITDGAFTGKRAWHDGDWHYISDLGAAAAYAHTMDAALTLGEEVAGLEGIRLDKEIEALQNSQSPQRPGGEQ